MTTTSMGAQLSGKYDHYTHRVLVEQPVSTGAEQLARQFSRSQTRRVWDLLQTLVALGKARKLDDSRFAPP